MAKVVMHILAAVGIGYYAYRVCKKALDEEPEETRVYSSELAAAADDAEDDWFVEAPEGY